METVSIVLLGIHTPGCLPPVQSDDPTARWHLAHGGGSTFFLSLSLFLREEAAARWRPKIPTVRLDHLAHGLRLLDHLAVHVASIQEYV